jgi:hypothetical protein
MNIEAVLRLSTLIAAAGSVLLALEDWLTREEFSDEGLMAWPVAQLQWHWSADERVMRRLRALYGYRTFKLLTLARLVLSALLVPSCLFLGSLPVGLLVVGVLLLLVTAHVRTPYGGDGADQMIVIVLAGVGLGWLLPEGGLAQKLALWFVTLQLVLSYGVAGVAKAVSRKWWDGTGLTGIFSTYSYGSPRFSAVANRWPALMIAMSWSVILFEAGFPAALFAPKELVALFFLVGALFHLGTAVLMSLNTFLFAFLAAYPIAWYCLVGN